MDATRKRRLDAASLRPGMPIWRERRAQRGRQTRGVWVRHRGKFRNEPVAPLRTGRQCKLLKLREIRSFGQSRVYECSPYGTAENKSLEIKTPSPRRVPRY